MKVRAGRGAALAEPPDDLTALHIATIRDVDRLQVRVEGLGMVGVTDADVIAPQRVVARGDGSPPTATTGEPGGRLKSTPGCRFLRPVKGSGVGP